MKVILSRKGFDKANGGCASPILPNGTMLSLPIPSNDDVKFSDLQYGGKSYYDIIKSINPNFSAEYCHLDPDIREGIRKNAVSDWKPAFGQIGAAQGELKNAGVDVGDIFLFFGWFRRVRETENGYKFITRRHGGSFYDYADLHAVYGYMQVGKIITDKAEIEKYPWHPHASAEHTRHKTNALYIPAEKLSLNPKMPAFGTLDYRKDRVLTMENKSRAVWNYYDFLAPDKVYGNRKNSAENGRLFYGGIWQELIVNESDKLLEWVSKILS